MTWTWWMTLLVILGVLFLIGCIPVGIEALQDKAGLRLDARIWMFRIQLIPKKPGKPKKKKKKPKPQQPAEEKPQQAAVQPEKKKPKFSLKGNGDLVRLGIDSLFELLGILGDFLGGFRRKLRIDDLTLHVTFGGSDPAKTAVQYGRAWAVVGALTPALEQVFVIKNRDISPILDYNSNQTELYGHLYMTVTIGRLLGLALRMLGRSAVLAFRTWRSYKGIRKQKRNHTINEGGANK